MRLNILAVDTALGACSVAMATDGALRAHAFELMARGHAEALAPMTDHVMREAGCAFAELARLGVTVGPGTFTGQRIGLAFVRGLALALNIPAIGVTTLDAMIEAAFAEKNAPWALCAADAKRGELYVSARAAGGEELIAPALLGVAQAAVLAAQVARAAGPEFLCAGTGAGLILGPLQDRGLRPYSVAIHQPDARFVARLALRATPAGGAPRPLYLRAPDAKLPEKRSPRAK